jgi:phage shock protein C
MTTAATNEIETIPTSDSSERQVPLPLRSDTFLGVCEAIGQDFGFNPNYLRVVFGVLLLWNPLVVLSVYFGLGCVIAATRWFFPAAERSTPQAPIEQMPAAEAEKAQVEERLAA